MEIKVTWNKLTEAEREQAINSYADIRSNEEGEPYSIERAREMAPYCRAFYRDDTGYIWVVI